jgi:hypothetical protein
MISGKKIKKTNILLKKKSKFKLKKINNHKKFNKNLKNSNLIKIKINKNKTKILYNKISLIKKILL